MSTPKPPKGTIVITATQLAEGFRRERRRGEWHRWKYAVIEDRGDGTFLVHKPPRDGGMMIDLDAHRREDATLPRLHSTPGPRLD